MLPLNIRVDRNCQPTWVTQNAIPGELELISLGGGHYDPLPDKVGLKTKPNFSFPYNHYYSWFWLLFKVLLAPDYYQVLYKS